MSRPFVAPNNIGAFSRKIRESQIVKEKSIATFTVHKPAEMNKVGRRSVAAWLRRTADFLESDGANMSEVFTARYMER